MPTNKNALRRYTILDELLSDRIHDYTLNDLTEKCNERLEAMDAKSVSRRCIEKDLEFIEYGPFGIDIERKRKDGRLIIRYEDTSRSIFRKELSDEESNLILEVLNTIGQFDGLAHFEWLDKFKVGLGLKKRPKIISFSNNPYLRNSNLLGTLFDYISNKVVIRLSYHTFSDKNVRSIDFHPYLLKQYNNRWFLIGAADSDQKILNFPLDRIDNVKHLPRKKYIECSQDLSERFENIIGVTLYEDRPIEHIVFWVSNNSQDYVSTKPIHESQKKYKGEKEQHFRSLYPNLDGGSFFSIDCIQNYELIRELCAYGKELIVLEPDHIQQDICLRIQEMIQNYQSITKK